MHDPTLALAYSLDSGAPQADSAFDVSLQSPFSQTVLVETGALTDWTYRWFDLSAWQGERVTLTLRLQQAVNEPYMRLRLDEVSLGSWLTPLITGVSPSEAPARTALLVTICGENFIKTPSVSVGGVPANQVTLVDDHTLTALLPADIAPGYYPLTVTNPGGQQAVYPAVVVGEHIFLPVLGRQLLP